MKTPIAGETVAPDVTWEVARIGHEIAVTIRFRYAGPAVMHLLPAQSRALRVALDLAEHAGTAAKAPGA